ncbi:MAG TPA: hypothetical protein VKB23_06880 [Solirubrobacterales bacterium]|nr:hypothetical protein [Solirubrobacterales bacterium]
MKQLGNALSYSNVVATLALFLALGGGVVYAASTLGKNSVKSKNIAANAVKARNLAKSAVKTKSLAANSVTTAKIKKDAITSGKVKKSSLGRSDLAAGTLAGLQVAEVTAAAVPGLNVRQPGGTPIPLTGTPTFTPVAGKSYELLVELKGNPLDADGSGEGFCSAFVDLLVNGAPVNGAGISQDASGAPPFNNEPIGTSSAAVALQAAGQPQTLTALAFGNDGCSSATAASLRAVVIELG